MRYHSLLPIICLLLTAVAIDCTAQSAQQVDTTFRPHSEIGVDLLPLIDKENVPKNSLFVRRNYFQKHGLGRAWRMRAGVEVEIRDFQDVGRWVPDTYRTYAPYLSVGHEWQHIGRGFRWYVATEGFGSYYRQKFKYLNLPTPDLEGGYINSHIIGIMGAMGFQIKLSSSVWVASEANLSGYYSKYKFQSDRLPVGTGGHSEELEKIFALKFRPLYVINIIYSIKAKHHENKKN